MNLGTCWLIFSRKITLTTLASALALMQGLHWPFVTLTAEGVRGFMIFRNPSADMLHCEAELDVNLIEKVKFCIFRVKKNKGLRRRTLKSKYIAETTSVSSYCRHGNGQNVWLHPLL